MSFISVTIFLKFCASDMQQNLTKQQNFKLKFLEI